MEDDNNDDLFETIFEVDQGFTESEGGEGDDDDKEDDKENQNRSTKAKKLQFKKINDFMKEHRKETIDKKQWRQLTSELNSLGPPTFTESQWKFKWSQHKYNKTRKQATNAAVIPGPSYEETQLQSVLSSDPLQNIELTSHETVNSIPEITDKLNVIIQKQDAILVKLERGNNLLQEISQSLNKQNL